MRSMQMLLFLLLICVGLIAAQSNDLVDCKKHDSDVLLHTKKLERSYQLLRTQESNVVYSNPNAIITCIEVLDQRTDGTGGHPSIQSGGVGHNNVTINVRSQFSRGFEFVINIYGH
ncbi:hypothetical protein L9F63_022534 [Diploptera punctata]|uniref:Salivary secreted peptide n=1 Tax=Diploptera punctata TaxID=6984 RepID=A0AAD8EAA9_DIPPU|nr:hypothetical protein L9F63_022534 [Diploptera punctata]